jgi:hypothetical protein
VTPGAIRGGFVNDARVVSSVAATFAREHGYEGRGDLDPQLEPGTPPTTAIEKLSTATVVLLHGIVTVCNFSLRR